MCGRLIFIHLQFWEVLFFFTIQRQRCIQFRVLRAQNFCTPLALNCEKGQHLPALEVYKNQSPSVMVKPRQNSAEILGVVVIDPLWAQGPQGAVLAQENRAAKSAGTALLHPHRPYYGRYFVEFWWFEEQRLAHQQVVTVQCI